MLTPSDMYWLTRLDGLVGSGIILGIFACFALLFCIVAAALEQECYAAGIVSALLMLTGWGMAVFIPTTKEAVAIYVIPAIANNESVRAIPDTAARLADEWLKQKLGEITGEEPAKK